jgi:FixJ family two-component response regulator
MEARREMVYIVAGESPGAQDLSAPLRANGKVVRPFTSIRGFIEFDRNDSCACLIVSLKPSGMRQEAMDLISYIPVPVIFIAGRSDTPSAVNAMKAGAIDVLTKPVDEAALLVSVQSALQLDRANRREATERARLVDRYESLTPREREILPLLTNGLLNKQAAFELGITEYTVQIHRGHIMRKMEADSFATLVKIATKLKLEPEPAEESNQNA